MPTPLRLKPATAAWIVRERKRLGLKPKDVADRLQAMGLENVSEATVKVWEANGDRRPGPENLDGLERLFGSAAPDAAVAAGDQAELVAAIRELVEEMRLAREGADERDAALVRGILAGLLSQSGGAGSGAQSGSAVLPQRRG